jgi:hypothetical protein
VTGTPGWAVAGRQRTERPAATRPQAPWKR